MNQEEIEKSVNEMMIPLNEAITTALREHSHRCAEANWGYPEYLALVSRLFTQHITAAIGLMPDCKKKYLLAEVVIDDLQAVVRIIKPENSKIH